METLPLTHPLEKGYAKSIAGTKRDGYMLDSTFFGLFSRSFCQVNSWHLHWGAAAVAPIGLISWRAGTELVSEDRQVVRTAPVAGSYWADKRRPLTTFALEHNTLRAPPIYLAKSYLSGFVLRFSTLDNLHHRLPFFARPVATRYDP